MKSRDYWKKRAESISNNEFKKVDNYKLQLELQYQEALKSIQEEIEGFYKKCAKNNKISLIEAKKTLNSNEFHEFKMSLEEFKRKAKSNKNGKWEKELNNVSCKARITRLQALQTQTMSAIEELHGKQKEGTTRLLKGVYEDTYYRNIYEAHKGLGIGINFAKLDTKTIGKIVNEPWYGGNYSSRIWNNKEILIKELQSNLVKSFTLGSSIDKTSKIIANRMNVGIGRARMLVNTESAYIASKSTLDSYEKSGVVKQYEILATLDLHTSKICRRLDGKVFKVSEKEIGVNAPPFHPNCRSTTIAYFDDAIDDERIARDIDDKNHYVDGNMKYDDWYDKYVKEKNDIGLKNNATKIDSKLLTHANDEEVKHNKKQITAKYTQCHDKDGENSYVNDKGDFKNFIKNLFNKSNSKNEILSLNDLPKVDYDNITGIVSNAPIQFQQVFLRHVDNIRFLDIEYNKGGKYSPKNNAIYINLKDDRDNIKGKGAYTTFFHELGHLIDKNMGRPSTDLELSKNFKSAIITDINEFIASIKNNYNIKSQKELYDLISTQLKGKIEYHSISDIFGGVTGNKIVGKFSHETDYWNTEGALERETFAHFFEATIRDDKLKLEMFKNILPNAYDTFINLLKGV